MPAMNTICLWYERDALDAARFYAARDFQAIKIYNSMNPEWIPALVKEAKALVDEAQEHRLNFGMQALLQPLGSRPGLRRDRSRGHGRARWYGARRDGRRHHERRNPARRRVRRARGSAAHHPDPDRR